VRSRWSASFFCWVLNLVFKILESNRRACFSRCFVKHQFEVWMKTRLSIIAAAGQSGPPAKNPQADHRPILMRIT